MHNEKEEEVVRPSPRPINNNAKRPICLTCKRDDGWVLHYRRNYYVIYRVKPEGHPVMCQDKEDIPVCWYCFPGNKAPFYVNADLDTMSRVLIQDPLPPCLFCRRRIPAMEAPLHYDQSGLCGLRKTTLLGRCISVLQSVVINYDLQGDDTKGHALDAFLATTLGPVEPNPPCYVIYADMMSESWKIRNGCFPYKKEVHFEDEYKLRQEIDQMIKLTRERVRRRNRAPNQKEQDQQYNLIEYIV